jgi:hypothetical protein
MRVDNFQVSIAIYSKQAWKPAIQQIWKSALLLSQFALIVGRMGDFPYFLPPRGW